jgi:Tetratricopeptide repeat/Mitochondrial biogenesis AIM24
LRRPSSGCGDKRRTMPDVGRSDEFAYLVTEGSDHLQAGRFAEARAHLERALQLQPKNEQAHNLLGLSVFRLGHLEEAKAIFAALVHNNPIEPSLRLNLAMVHLKQARLDDAHQELVRVLDLNPDHPRASSYMGLVLERKGRLEEAASFYEKGGNQKRAAEIRAFRPTATGTFPLVNLTAMGVQAPPSLVPGPAGMASVPPAPLAAVTTPAQFPAPANWARNGSAEAAALTAYAAQELRKLEARTPSQPTAPAPPVVVAPPSLASMLPSTASMPPLSASLPTSPASQAAESLPAMTVRAWAGVAAGVASAAMLEATTIPERSAKRAVVTFPVIDVAYAQVDRLLASRGVTGSEPIHRRYRGKRTDSVFGGVESAMIACRGSGALWLDTSKIVGELFHLQNEELYALESAVVAFSSGLAWENGRLPAENDRDLDIVHLRGQGRVLIGTLTSLQAAEVRPNEPVVVDARRLVGWSGSLVPLRGQWSGLPEGRRSPTVRFDGTGLVLFA